MENATKINSLYVSPRIRKKLDILSEVIIFQLFKQGIPEPHGGILTAIIQSLLI